MHSPCSISYSPEPAGRRRLGTLPDNLAVLALIVMPEQALASPTLRAYFVQHWLMRARCTLRSDSTSALPFRMSVDNSHANYR
jgi:hypothetical protein